MTLNCTLNISFYEKKVLFYLKIIILQFLNKGDLRIHAGEAEKEMIGMKILKIEI